MSGQVGGGTEAMKKNFDKIRQRVPFGLATPEDVAEVVVELVTLNQRSLASRVELRPSRPPRKG